MSLDINGNNWDKLYAHLKLSKEMLEDALYGLEDNRFRLFQSRLYYSCFHLVNALFYKYGILNDKKEISSHKELRAAFNKFFIYEENIFDSSFLKILRNSSAIRDKADYNVDAIFSKEASLENYNEVRIFMDTIKDKINESLKRI